MYTPRSAGGMAPSTFRSTTVRASVTGAELPRRWNGRSCSRFSVIGVSLIHEEREGPRRTRRANPSTRPLCLSWSFVFFVSLEPPPRALDQPLVRQVARFVGHGAIPGDVEPQVEVAQLPLAAELDLL